MAAAYGVVAWAVIEVCATVVPALHLPDAITTALVLLALAGFPLALVLAWAFDVKPTGLERAPAGTAGNFWLVALLGLLVAVAGGAFFFWPKTPAPGPAAELKSIAVLPFANLSGDPANEYFSDGITEEILRALSHLRDLRVASRTSAFAFKGKNEDVARIAQALRVSNVLEGSVQRAGDHVRIIAQLVDARNGFQLWSDRFDRETKDLFAVQDEVAAAIARALKLQFSARAVPGARAGTENADSHDFYLRALDSFTAPQEALEFVDRALALDPKFAAAFALKAQIFSSLAFASPDKKSWEHYVEQGEAAARRAVALAPETADAYAALGEMARRRNDFATARAHFERATQLKPGDPILWQGLGLTVSPYDPAAGLASLRKAKALGGENPFLDRQIAYALSSLGRTDEAHETIAQAHDARPDFIPILIDLGREELWVHGRPDRALEKFVEAYRKAPSFIDAQVPVTFYPALVYALSGHWPQAEIWRARAAATAAEADAVLVVDLLFAGLRHEPERARALAGEFQERGADRILLAIYAGDAATLAGDWPYAAALYRKVLADSKDPADSLRTRRVQTKLAYVLGQLHEETESARLLQVAAKNFPAGPQRSLINWTFGPVAAVQYLDAELAALRGEKARSLAALEAMLALPDDGLILLGSLPLAIDESPLLASLRAEPRFLSWQQEVARRRAILRARVSAARLRLDLGED